MIIRTCVCIVCGRRFEAKQPGALSCSPECRHERIKARNNSHYAANRESALATVKAYRDANREIIAAKNKAYYEKNAERLRARRREQRRLRKLESAQSAPPVGDGDDR
jgi:hypothetical protein